MRRCVTVDHIGEHLAIKPAQNTGELESAHALPWLSINGDVVLIVGCIKFLSRFSSMPASARRLISNMIDDLKEERDELALQVHLGKQEAKSELKRLSKKLDELNERSEPLKNAVGESGEDVWVALQLLGDEIKEGYQRIRQSIS
ncbi:hypothetical protein [Rhodopirellula bahusiensis]|uniref:hypothetical protein n=1 Tax=Rhodopirellula bahusiensis TaxID=2014065 RepID=UPI0032653959